jgi:DNA polymerase-3 subunit alpha (Gram-positive type)
VTTLQGVIGCRDDIMNDLIGYGIDNSKAFKIMEYVRKNKVGKPLKQEDIDEMKKHNVPGLLHRKLQEDPLSFPTRSRYGLRHGSRSGGLVQDLSSA